MPEDAGAYVTEVTEAMVMERIKRSRDFERLRDLALSEMRANGAVREIEDEARREAEVVVAHEGKRVG